MNPETISVPDLATIGIIRDDTFGNVVVVRLDNKLDGTVDFFTPDIDDNLGEYLGEDWKPGGLYYSSTVDTEESRRRIAVLLEELAQRPDGEPILAKLKAVLPAHHWYLQDFERPGTTLSSKLCTAILPPAPKQPRHIVYSFGELKLRFKWRHYVFAIPMLIGTFYLIYLQTQVFSWMGYSPLTGTIELGKKFGMWTIAALMLLVFLDNKLVRRKKGSSYSRFTIGLFNKAALNEEQAWREGAENWNIWQRFRSCLSFGLIHQPSLIYVFGMFVPHMIMGAVFMTVYLHNYRRTQRRRNAVLAAAVFHRVYNRVALSVVVVSLLAYTGLASWSWVTGLGGVVFTWTAMAVSNRRNPSSKTS